MDLMKNPGLLLLLLLVANSSAVSIHSEKTMIGIGYMNTDTAIETHTDYSSGHSAVIDERGSGIINDTIIVKLSTQNKTLSIHADVNKEYSPISYNGKLYDRHWKYRTIVKNYMVGGAINSAYENSQNIKEESDWISNKNVTFLTSKTTYLGESHFGIKAVNTNNPKKTIMDSFRDTIGLFTEERVVAITNNTSPHSSPISCP